MNNESRDVQNFANTAQRFADPGFRTDASVPAMTTPTVALTPAAAEYVVAGSTICLIC